MGSYIGIDLGTSAVKLLLLRENGDVLGTAEESYPVSYPRAGWAEQDPQAWYTAAVRGIRQLLEGHRADEVRGIGIAGQMHGLVLLNRNGVVLRPAILWNDGRSAAETERLNREIGEKRLLELTGNIAYAGFTLPKLLWVRANEPELYRQTATVLLPKDELVRRLTGVCGTEPSDACGILLYDGKHARWSEELTEQLAIPTDLLPPVRGSAEMVGTLLPEVARETGLSERVFVVAGAGDNAAAALGNGVIDAGDCNLSLGTSGTLLFPCADYPSLTAPTLHTFIHADGKPMLLGCILNAASAGAWWVEGILGSGNFGREMANLRCGRADDPYFLPYLMGERSPHNDPAARGVFFGMSGGTDRAAMTRAVYEGVSFALRDCAEEARRTGISLQKVRLCGGGARSGEWSRLLADVLNVTVDVPEQAGGPSKGGAMLAAVADGCFPSVRDAAERLKPAVAHRYEPTPARCDFYAERYAFFRTLYPAMKKLWS